ncbi:GMC family oxidoreductase N-terminal domain-containing protein [Zooshikella harenae]|uniref:GMC family oxidoreductase n=1 Tax=Zooshikella harenae TaxID=2827238 RepID=A0ABS5ZEI8_9GAMM|nr:GMC family oxidoreductase [Zooshikella harenae]MBU2712400.1 GMC family oxidoreductase [Zooshikella harenae]
MNEIFDFVIVGSGAAGSVLSFYLTQAGASVCLIEAGKSFFPGEYPTDELTANSQLMWHGGADLNTQANLILLRGKTVGGGTVINQCLLDRFDTFAWNLFKQSSDVTWFTNEVMHSHYSAIEQQLSIQTITESHWNHNAKLYANGFEKLKLDYAPLQRGQSHCNNMDCIVCLGGCNRNSKQSMPTTFLKLALRQKLKLISQYYVTNIIPGKNMISIYGNHITGPRVINARHCILAAGALGTTEVLLRTGFAKKLPALGKGFYCHPQFMYLAQCKEPVDAHLGNFQGIKSTDTRFRKLGFKLENVFARPIGIALLKSGYGLDHQAFMQKFRHLACIEVAIRDEFPGLITLENNRLAINKTLNDSDKQKANSGKEVVFEIFDQINAVLKEQPTYPIGLHLMGGCAMGHHIQSSVVNEQFGVWGEQRLSIVDGSIFPVAPGINPSLTIMALAHRASQFLLSQHTTIQKTTNDIQVPTATSTEYA